MISVGIGIAILFAVRWIIEFEPSDIPAYTAVVTGWVAELFSNSLTFPQAYLIGRIVIAVLILSIVLSAFMIPMRATGVLRKTVTLGDRFLIVMAMYFVIALTAFMIYALFKFHILDMFRGVGELHKTNRAVHVGVLVLIVGIYVAVLIFVLMHLAVLASVFKTNIQVNGVVPGIISGAYDLLSSIFIVAAVVAVICFGIACILFVILLATAAFSDGRKRLVCIDGEYYWVY